MEKVISIRLLLRPGQKEKEKEDAGVAINEFKEIKEALSEGYSVKQVITTKVDGLYWINHLFILEKQGD
jgi:hypothetical protein